MGKAFTLLLMLFLHVFDDYTLQGILSLMKQKSWWKQNAPEAMYRYDYIAAMTMHAFSWTFLIMLPIAMISKFNIDATFVWLFLANLICHGVVDHSKANMGKINLITDQTIHVMQILLTWASLV